MTYCLRGVLCSVVPSNVCFFATNSTWIALKMSRTKTRLISSVPEDMDSSQLTMTAHSTPLKRRNVDRGFGLELIQISGDNKKSCRQQCHIRLEVGISSPAQQNWMDHIRGNRKQSDVTRSGVGSVAGVVEPGCGTSKMSAGKETLYASLSNLLYQRKKRLKERSCRVWVSTLYVRYLLFKDDHTWMHHGVAVPSVGDEACKSDRKGC
ncbi:uncharacterized protein LOC121177933 isoform X2 [Toxotes jaculatrix]|uniref:uncharacterized protein LOC121177933 isoform X2 n=1 Tax=Toxotes jaculatrix TaxID=941984 RepID=UPI001B3AD6C2|nr:uncharacterized protein LOC121177933 isoform X2 [Toxotes jaculatrix]